MNVDLQDRDLRQRDLVPSDQLVQCCALVIGVGAIGRQVALQLSAMGIADLTLVDFDTVNVVNLAPQGYAPDDLGKPKVEATAVWCRRLNPNQKIHIAMERFRRSSSRHLPCFGLNGEARRLAVFCCVDSITAREICWDGVKNRAALFADGRMSAEVIRVVASDHPATDSYYASTLFAQEEAHVGGCTSKSTIYTASIAAGFMLSQFTHWLRGIPIDRNLTLNLLAAELTVG